MTRNLVIPFDFTPVEKLSGQMNYYFKRGWRFYQSNVAIITKPGKLGTIESAVSGFVVLSTDDDQAPIEFPDIQGMKVLSHGLTQ